MAQACQKICAECNSLITDSEAGTVHFSSIHYIESVAICAMSLNALFSAVNYSVLYMLLCITSDHWMNNCCYSSIENAHQLLPLNIYVGYIYIYVYEEFRCKSL